MSDTRRYELTVKAGAWFADESDPPGHRTANLATDVTVPIWPRPEDGELLERLLEGWNEVAVRRADDGREAVPA